MDNKISSETAISEKLTFRKETIEHQIDAYNLRKDNAKDTQFLWGISITFAVALASTQVENLGTDQQNIGQSLLGLLLAASLSLTIRKTIQYFRMEDPIKQLKNALYESYINKPDLNVLFIIKREVDNKTQLLVMKNNAWDCYFLPYVGIRTKTTDVITYSKNKIENILGLKRDSTIATRLLEHQEKTEKHHPQENVIKEYHSYYVHLKSRDESTPNFIENSSFAKGNFIFEWKSFDELEKDQKTIERNGDVLKLVREHYNDFISESSCFHDV